MTKTSGWLPSFAATSVVPELPQPTTKPVASGAAIGLTLRSSQSFRRW
jgi:hypothetical protein